MSLDSFTALTEISDEKTIESQIESIFESDRKSTFTAYNETAQWLAHKMKSFGLTDVEVEPVPADGKTTFSDWVMPMAWDAEEGRLDLLNLDGTVEETLADYQELYDHLVIGSAPTPDEGVTTELVDVDEIDLGQTDLTGKVAFTGRKGSEIKRAVAQAGGIGILSYYNPSPDEDPNSICWNNTWGDRPGAWWQTAQDSRVFGFSISPAQGQKLKARLGQEGSLKVHALVKTRLYEGTLPFATGRIEGSEAPEEEVIVQGHIYEHGAHDNASGGGTILEIARVISKGVAQGIIPQPKRSLRFLFVAECFGSFAYAALCKDRLMNTVASINLDGVGAAWPLSIHRELDCTRSPLAPVLKLMAEDYFKYDPESRVQEELIEMGDTVFQDPLFGVPTIWPHRACTRQTWHTSLDTMDVIDTKAVKEMTVLIGAFMLKIADFNSSDVEEAAQACIDRTKPRLKAIITAGGTEEKFRHEVDIEEEAIGRIEKLVVPSEREQVRIAIGEAQEELRKSSLEIRRKFKRTGMHDGGTSGSQILAGVIPEQEKPVSLDSRVFSREIPGPLSFDILPLEKTKEVGFNPKWSPAMTAVFWWINGTRTVGEIADLVVCEFNFEKQKTQRYINILFKLGYLTLVSD
jgi:hypothetical protein